MKKSKEMLGNQITYESDQQDLAKEFNAGQPVNKNNENDFEKDFEKDDTYSLFDHFLEFIKNNYKEILLVGAFLAIIITVLIIVGSCNGWCA